MIKKYGSQDKLSEETIAFIKSIMHEFNVDPNQMNFIPWNQNLCASATDTIIFINEKLLNKLRPETKKFVIGHELIHVIHKDHSTRYFIRNTKPIKLVHDNDIDNPLNKVCQFHELRADMLSCLHGMEYTEGNLDFMNQQISSYGDAQMCSYPKYSLRRTIGTKIAALLNNTPIIA
jgi:hypothetical protein